MKQISHTASCHKPPLFERSVIQTNRWTSNIFWDIIDMLAFKHPTIAHLYERAIAKYYHKEFTTFSITKNDKILHIGCGSYPLTEITLATHFNATCVGLDNNPAVVSMAQQLIQRKNLQDKVTIQHGDGRDYPLKKFNIIIVSSCSVPKTQIIDHIIQNAANQTRIIFRELESATQFMKQCINDYNAISIEQEINHRAITFLGPISWNAVLLTKK